MIEAGVTPTATKLYLATHAKSVVDYATDTYDFHDDATRDYCARVQAASKKVSDAAGSNYVESTDLASLAPILDEVHGGHHGGYERGLGVGVSRTHLKSPAVTSFYRPTTSSEEVREELTVIKGHYTQTKEELDRLRHQVDLLFCIWDHFKELETMELHRSKNLARFVSEMLSAFTLSLSLLKTVDLADPAQLAPKRIMHFRMLFEAIFDNTDAVVWNIFTRAAAIPELEMLRSSFVFFIKQYVVAVNAQNSTLEKFKLAKKALYNVAGVLM